MEKAVRSSQHDSNCRLCLLYRRKKHREAEAVETPESPREFRIVVVLSSCVERLAVIEGQTSEARRRALLQLFERIVDLTTPPESMLSLIKLLGDANSSSAEICEAIKRDPALTTRILRIVNSSHYGLRNRVASIPMAVGLLGLREIRALAQRLHCSQLFTASGTYRNYSRRGLWRHSVAVARMSQHIAETIDQPDVEEIYLAGLLHDVGWMLLDQSLRRSFCKILDRLTPETPIGEVEQDILSFSHTHLGAFVTERWHVPQSIVTVAEFHHSPQHCEGPHRRVVQIVAAANYFISRHGAPALGVDNTLFPGDPFFQELSLDEKRCADLVELVPRILSDVDSESL